MSILLEERVPAPTVPHSANGHQRLVLYNVSWQEYITIGQQLADRPALRMTFDRGTLEFMTPSSRHEIIKHWFGRFLETIAEELRTPIAPAGSMTFQREELERGFEPDNCYWIENELSMRGVVTWDPEKHPPPDLMLEIEITRSALPRLKIFAAFRVPEIWCYDEEEVRIHQLQADGTYQQSTNSLAFPSVPARELSRFLKTIETTDYLSAVAAVRTWVRAQIDQSA